MPLENRIWVEKNAARTCLLSPHKSPDLWKVVLGLPYRVTGPGSVEGCAARSLAVAVSRGIAGGDSTTTVTGTRALVAELQAEGQGSPRRGRSFTANHLRVSSLSSSTQRFHGPCRDSSPCSRSRPGWLASVSRTVTHHQAQDTSKESRTCYPSLLWQNMVTRNVLSNMSIPSRKSLASIFRVLFSRPLWRHEMGQLKTTALCKLQSETYLLDSDFGRKVKSRKLGGLTPRRPFLYSWEHPLFPVFLMFSDNFCRNVKFGSQKTAFEIHPGGCTGDGLSVLARLGNNSWKAWQRCSCANCVLQCVCE